MQSVGRFTLVAPPGRSVHSDTNSASSGSILARQQLRATSKSVTFTQLSIARYSFIQLSQQRRQWRERKCQIFETVAKGGSNLGSLGCEKLHDLRKDGADFTDMEEMDGERCRVYGCYLSWQTMS